MSSNSGANTAMSGISVTIFSSGVTAATGNARSAQGTVIATRWVWTAAGAGLGVQLDRGELDVGVAR
jgi:hypothetical protein